MGPKGTVSTATSPEPIGVSVQPSQVGLNLIKILDSTVAAKDGPPSSVMCPSISTPIPAIELPHPQPSNRPELHPTGNPDSVSLHPTSSDAADQTTSSTFSTSSCSTSSAHCRRLSGPSPEQIKPTSLSSTPRAAGDDAPSLPYRHELRLGGESPKARFSKSHSDGAFLALVAANLANVHVGDAT
jgi:hypothetical protein